MLGFANDTESISLTKTILDLFPSQFREWFSRISNFNLERWIKRHKLQIASAVVTTGLITSLIASPEVNAATTTTGNNTCSLGFVPGDQAAFDADPDLCYSYYTYTDTYGTQYIISASRFVIPGSTPSRAHSSISTTAVGKCISGNQTVTYASSITTADHPGGNNKETRTSLYSYTDAC